MTIELAEPLFPKNGGTTNEELVKYLKKVTGCTQVTILNRYFKSPKSKYETVEYYLLY